MDQPAPGIVELLALALPLLTAFPALTGPAMLGGVLAMLLL